MILTCAEPTLTKVGERQMHSINTLPTCSHISCFQETDGVFYTIDFQGLLKIQQSRASAFFPVSDGFRSFFSLLISIRTGVINAIQIHT